MNKKLIILGAGGHGKILDDIALLNGYEEIYFLDDNYKKEYPYRILGKINTFADYIDDYNFIIAIGNNKIRQSLFKLIYNANGEIINLIHPNAIIAADVQLERGIAIMAGCVVNSGAVIKNGCIINTSVSIDHDTVIGEFVHISPGCHLAGEITVGSETWIGIGSNIINNIFMVEKCVLGAGSVVIKDINEPGTYVGVPVRKI